MSLEDEKFDAVVKNALKACQMQLPAGFVQRLQRKLDTMEKRRYKTELRNHALAAAAVIVCGVLAAILAPWLGLGELAKECLSTVLLLIGQITQALPTIKWYLLWGSLAVALYLTLEPASD